MTVPARGASFHVLPAVPKRLEGLDYTLAIVDEAGRVDQEVYEVVALATGKQKASVVLAIGTPGPELDQTVLGRLRDLRPRPPRRPAGGLAGALGRRVRGPPRRLPPLLGAGQPGPR